VDDDPHILLCFAAFCVKGNSSAPVLPATMVGWFRNRVQKNAQSSHEQLKDIATACSPALQSFLGFSHGIVATTYNLVRIAYFELTSFEIE
jgi:hypothetical protein